MSDSSNIGTILLVDDSEEERYLFKTILEKENYTVIEAVHGADAIHEVDTREIDLVLLDIQMPLLDGLEVLEYLRDETGPTDLAVIMMTAVSSSEEIVNALDKGANDFITKPIDIPVALSRIRTQIQLVRAVHMKNDLVRMVAHDMKTPLTSIIGSLDAVTNDFNESTSEDVRDLIEIAFRGANRLERLVKNMLDWERIQSGHFSVEMKEIRLDEIVKTAFEELAYYAEIYKIQLKSEVPSAKAMGNADAIFRVLTNLISNAIKFTRKGGSVIVTVAFVRKGQDAENADAAINSLRSGQFTTVPSASAGEAIVAVIDEGRGIPYEDQTAIFESYRQSFKSDSTEMAGHGLGLPISQKLIEAHGSKLWLASQEGLGTTFFFPLEIAK